MGHERPLQSGRTLRTRLLANESVVCTISIHQRVHSSLIGLVAPPPERSYGVPLRIQFQRQLTMRTLFTLERPPSALRSSPQASVIPASNAMSCCDCAARAICSSRSACAAFRCLLSA